MPWSYFFECWVLSQLFHSPLLLSSRGSVPVHSVKCPRMPVYKAEKYFLYFFWQCSRIISASPFGARKTRFQLWCYQLWNLGKLFSLPKSPYLSSASNHMNTISCIYTDIYVCVLCLVAQSCLTLCDPMGCSPPPGDLPNPDIEPRSPAL